MLVINVNEASALVFYIQAPRAIAIKALADFLHTTGTASLEIKVEYR